MKVEYTSVWKLQGLTNIEGTSAVIQIGQFSAPEANFQLTCEPRKYIEKIYQERAVATRLLKGTFTPTESGSTKDTLQHEIREIFEKNQQLVSAGVFLVLQGCVETKRLERAIVRETEGSCNQASMSTVILCSGAVYFGVKTSA